jgi:undecaprenyl-diphosphatase
MSLGVSREEITEYSFLLAVPTMVAATGLDVIKNKDMILHSGNLALLLVGLITAFIFAMLAIKGFMSYVRKNDFLGFGIYRIAIAVFGFLFLINIAQ